MAQRRKSLRRKSLRRNNRTTLKRGGMDKTNKPVKAEETSKKNDPSSIVHFPRTGPEWEEDLKRITSYKKKLDELAQKQKQ